ncbi:hypothetical protein O6H91_13G042600 [Diphasiastrum complanatum]|uniref:Uncharacterized protein n=1 Tax=Diphasiastrum complanatum TaxID=34168 RepID=A0ACC2BU87_DIPCM|nr:hypothetical protein O6H91_13G042600 [Diphasiastrum complanatum]
MDLNIDLSLPSIDRIMKGISIGGSGFCTDVRSKICAQLIPTHPFHEPHPNLDRVIPGLDPPDLTITNCLSSTISNRSGHIVMGQQSRQLHNNHTGAELGH